MAKLPSVHSDLSFHPNSRCGWGWRGGGEIWTVLGSWYWLPMAPAIRATTATAFRLARAFISGKQTKLYFQWNKSRRWWNIATNMATLSNGSPPLWIGLCVCVREMSTVVPAFPKQGLADECRRWHPLGVPSWQNHLATWGNHPPPPKKKAHKFPGSDL